ncbi:MAG: pyridoxamine kinase [Clostridiales bacterium]|nr:pyridoxamine kinase [Clostridiales bacterium]
MGKNILLINDLAGYGKVALSAMIPVLSHMGHHLYNLPTALVSNTLDYGKFDILETTEYMRNTIAVWGELGFRFDAISTGFIVSQEQAELIASYCKEQQKKRTRIFTDPIMGDEGKLYNGITETTIGHMRELVAVADCIVPNYTEAVYLAGMTYREDGISGEEAVTLIRRLRDIGSKSVVVTSARVEGEDAVIGYDADDDSEFRIPFSYVPVRFPGTGDIFSAILTGKMLDGCSLRASTAKAMDAVRELIIRNRGNEDKFKGIPIESCLEVIDR